MLRFGCVALSTARVSSEAERPVSGCSSPCLLPMAFGTGCRSGIDPLDPSRKTTLPRPTAACGRACCHVVVQEAGLMAALRHPNIVSFLGVCSVRDACHASSKLICLVANTRGDPARSQPSSCHALIPTFLRPGHCLTLSLPSSTDPALCGDRILLTGIPG